MVPGGKAVAAGGGDGLSEAGELGLWDAGTGKLLRQLLGADEHQVWSVAFTPDGKRLVGGSVRLLDVQTGRVLREFSGGDHVRGLAISSDGARSESYLVQPKCSQTTRILRNYSGLQTAFCSGKSGIWNYPGLPLTD